jgi:bisphosphoglycerate-independent phosphoglycerate mutase (AlkP superfamily)
MCNERKDLQELRNLVDKDITQLQKDEEQKKYLLHFIQKSIDLYDELEDTKKELNVIKLSSEDLFHKEESEIEKLLKLCEESNVRKSKIITILRHKFLSSHAVSQETLDNWLKNID